MDRATMEWAMLGFMLELFSYCKHLLIDDCVFGDIFIVRPASYLSI